MAEYNSNKAWLQAIIFFAIATVIGVSSGVSGQLLDAMPQLISGVPVWVTSAYLLVILVGYGLIWPRGTLSHGRKRHAWVALLFGTAWGLAQSQIFLSIWVWVSLLVPGPWWAALFCYGLIATYQGVWHGLYWDIHVSPPHNIRSWNARKVLLSHTPNLLFTLAILVVYDMQAAWLVTIGQCLALVLSCWFMHFPAPGDPGAPDPQPDD